MGSAPSYCLAYDCKNKRVYCWGSNGFKQLGLSPGPTLERYSSPQRLTLFDNEEILSIACHHGDHSFVSTSKGLFSFGYNARGQLGLGDTIPHIYPQRVKFFDNQEILSVACGSEHSLVLTSKGLFSFGYNARGQLGLGDTITYIYPQRVKFFDNQEILSVACGSDHSLVLTSKGLFSFGYNDAGQLGLGDTTVYPLPQRVEFFDNQEILFISCGTHYSIVSTSKGLFSFGYNDAGQLGLGDTTAYIYPQRVEFFDNQEILSVACGIRHTVVLTSKGLFSFGYNDKGQLGLGDTTARAYPQRVKFFDNQEILSVACGGLHTLVLTSEGLFSFGLNHNGQLGLGHLHAQASPQKIEFFQDCALYLTLPNPTESHSNFGKHDVLICFTSLF